MQRIGKFETSGCSAIALVATVLKVRRSLIDDDDRGAMSVRPEAIANFVETVFKVKRSLMVEG